MAAVAVVAADAVVAAVAVAALSAVAISGRLQGWTMKETQVAVEVDHPQG